MHCKLDKSLDMMAVVVDKDKRTTECLDVDRVQVMSYRVNYVGRYADFVLAFGGCDSTGKFHMDPKRSTELANCVIKDPVFGELFDDAVGNPIVGLSAKTIETVFAEHVLPIADKMCWQFDDVEMQMDGKTVFKKTRVKKHE